jgi:cytochrome P450
MVADRRRSPGDDLLTDMVTAQKEGVSPFSSKELIAVCVELLIAGHETTVSGIANGVIGLLQQSVQWERLCEDVNARCAGATEEILRWTTPLQWLRPRWTKVEVEIGGKRIAAGEPVYPVIAAANRDPEPFPDPHTLDIQRSGPRHLGFGHGAHACIGATLARMEIKAVVTALATRLPGLTIVPDQDFRWRPNGRMPGPSQVLVRRGSCRR